MGEAAVGTSTEAEPFDDNTLRELAADCRRRANELPTPDERQEMEARRHVDAFLENASSLATGHPAATRVLRDLLRRNPRLLAAPNRTHWTIWFMAQRLFESSVYDESRRCTGECAAPPTWHCPARPRGVDRDVDDPMHAACAMSLVFPYLREESDGTWAPNVEKAAKAIVRGFAALDDHQTVDAVRKVITRFPASH